MNCSHNTRAPYVCIYGFGNCSFSNEKRICLLVLAVFSGLALCVSTDVGLMVRTCALPGGSPGSRDRFNRIRSDMHCRGTFNVEVPHDLHFIYI